ncbi:MAG: phosphotransferase system enzyme I PtsP [Hyphomonadaceae bacterium]|nr:MAG: phosphotransferase system enzyme I PtsP [Hyphomonadaceae bacterium]KAF0184841.1 MAG: phosphotransferase system enzyme I PtsP [Hyphomonadaceae bacterium]
MNEISDAQTRMNHMVTQIANEMVADVCSIYLRRNDGSMELCATEGLKPEAVHNTRLKPSEGLVGLVADGVEPISLSDAPHHKRFSYRAETGEDPYMSFLGVPLLKGGRLIGVLVVQNRAAKSYHEDDIESLQTIATMLSEFVSTSSVMEQLQGFDIKPTQPETLNGKVFAKGLAFGKALLHAPEIEATRFLADDPEAEEARLLSALKDLRSGLELLLTGEAQVQGAVPLEVLEVILLLSQDRNWEKRLVEGVKSGICAEAAVEQVRSEHRAKMANAKDNYLRDRLQDLEELDNRLLRHLSGVINSHVGFDGEAVLVARDIGPAELLEYSGVKLSAILLEKGSSSSHAAIIARAMGLPMIGQMRGLLSRLQTNDPIIVDGNTGNAYLRYDPKLAEGFGSRLTAMRAETVRVQALRNIESKTKDGKRIHLLMNAGLVLDMEHLADSGAEGIGLFRTEFQFLMSNSLPRVDAQAELYSQIFELSGGKPVTFRTLDLGGDKIARFLSHDKEENPAMGWRALRFGLDRQAILRYQLRALLRAADGRPLRVMFPLVSEISEFDAAKALLGQEVDWAKKMGRKVPQNLEIGTMIEAPSIAWSINEISKKADFLSVGTNDLLQFFFAADRSSPKVNDRYDIMSKPALSFLKYVKTQAETTPISICGEHAGRPLEALALIGLGYDRLSMPATSLGIVKEMILSVNFEKLRDFVNSLLARENVDFRQELLGFAQDNGIIL